MIIHKLIDSKTACGMDVKKNEIEASKDWKEVNCKRCLKAGKK